MSSPDEKRAELIAKALKDPAFKAELLKDPAAAIEKASGLKLPAGITVKVVEDSASVVHLVLPAASSKPLGDKELGKVAGGAALNTQNMCGWDSTRGNCNF